jgi:hypothetical protein
VLSRAAAIVSFVNARRKEQPMDSSKQRKLAATVVGVMAVTGGGAAVAAAASGGSSSNGSTATLVAQRGPGDLLAAAASYLGVSASELQSDLQAGKTLAQVAASTDGKSVDGLIAALVANEQAEHPGVPVSELTQRVTDFVNGVRPPAGPGHGVGFPGLGTAASYLGLTADQLLAQLQSGNTLAQIANATSGKSADGLIQALVTADTARITAFVNGTATTS